MFEAAEMLLLRGVMPHGVPPRLSSALWFDTRAVKVQMSAEPGGRGVSHVLLLCCRSRSRV